MSGVENDGGDGAAVERELLEKNSNASLESSDNTTETQKSTISGIENDKDSGGDDMLTKAERRKMKKLLTKKSKATLGEILNPQYLQNVESATVGTHSGTLASKKKKKQKNENKNPASGDIKKTCENNKVIANEGSGATKVLEAISGEMDLSKSTNPDATILSKGEQTDVTNSKAGSNATTNLNLNDTTKEAANDDTGSGTPATNTTTSKKRKRQKSKKKNLPSGDIMITGENTQDNMITNEDPGTIKAFGAISGEMVLGKTAIHDGTILSKGEEHTEVTNDNTGSSVTKNLNVKGIAKKEAAISETGTSATTIIIMNGMAEKEAVIGEKGSGTIAMDTTISKKKKRLRSKKKKLASGDILITGESTQDKVIATESLRTTKGLEAISGEMVLGKSAIPDATILVKRVDHTEVTGGKTGSSVTTNLNVNGIAKKEAAIGETGTSATTNISVNGMAEKEVAIGEKGSGTTATDTTTSKKKKKKRSKKKKLALGDIMITCESTHDVVLAADKVSGATKVLDSASDEMILGKSAIPDATILSKGEEHTEVTNGKTGSTMTTNLYGIAEKEAANGDTGSITTATDTKASKKRKRKRLNQKKRLNKKKLASGDIMETCEGTQDMVVKDKGSGATKVLEAISDDMVSCKSAIPDALSKREERAEVTDGKMGTSATRNLNVNGIAEKEAANGETGLSATTNLNVNGIGEKEVTDGKTGLSATTNLDVNLIEEKEVTDGKTGLSATTNFNVNVIAENEVTDGKMGLVATMNHNVNVIAEKEAASGETGSGTTATDTTTSKKRKRKRQNSKKTNLSSSDIMESFENTSNNVIASKDSDTNKPLEALSTDSKREDLPGIVSGEECQKSVTVDKKSTMLKGIGCTDVANSEMGSSGTTTIVENTPVSKKTPQERKKQNSVGSNTNKNTKVKEIIQVATLGKKLIIFDVNGLLADVVSPPPKGIKADKVIPKRAIFKRPFLNDFLCFCFERFNVGIWSSRTTKVLNPVLDFLLGDLKKKLLFYWDASKCTNTGLRTLKDKHKCIVLKDLTKIWETNGPGNSWVKGTFNESNTLLLDDSPYKALLNPKHTGIFPVSYSYKNKDDDLLGPKGELRTYLEGLAATDNVKTYVEQHPFGQSPIDEKNPNWSFYSRVLKGQNR